MGTDGWLRWRGHSEHKCCFEKKRPRISKLSVHTSQQAGALSSLLVRAKLTQLRSTPPSPPLPSTQSARKALRPQTRAMARP